MQITHRTVPVPVESAQTADLDGLEAEDFFATEEAQTASLDGLSATDSLSANRSTNHSLANAVAQLRQKGVRATFVPTASGGLPKHVAIVAAAPGYGTEMLQRNVKDLGPHTATIYYACGGSGAEGAEAMEAEATEILKLLRSADQVVAYCETGASVSFLPALARQMDRKDAAKLAGVILENPVTKAPYSTITDDDGLFTILGRAITANPPSRPAGVSSEVFPNTFKNRAMASLFRRVLWHDREVYFSKDFLRRHERDPAFIRDFYALPLNMAGAMSLAESYGKVDLGAVIGKLRSQGACVLAFSGRQARSVSPDQARKAAEYALGRPFDRSSIRALNGDAITQRLAADGVQLIEIDGGGSLSWEHPRTIEAESRAFIESLTTPTQENAH